MHDACPDDRVDSDSHLWNTIHWVRDVLATAILVIGTVGVIVRLTVRDANLISGLFYYVTSPASLCVLASFVLFAVRRSWWRIRLTVILLLPIFIGWTYATQWSSNDESCHDPGRHVSRLMMWNTCDGHLGWGAIIKTIHEESPDILVLAEAETLKPLAKEFFERQFPGYQRLDLPRRLMVLTRCPIVENRRLAWIPGGVYEAVEIDTNDGIFTLVFSDIQSNLLTHRKAHIEKLNEVLQRLTGPVIFAGDLNTPVDSRFFDSVRTEFRNAFEVSGNGLHTTWPMPAPVLAIDHIWGNSGVEFCETRILWTLSSDHRPVIADFQLTE